MKIVSWNVNSIRKGVINELSDLINTHDVDIIAFQETKATGVDAEKYLLDHENVVSLYPFRYYNDSVSGQAGVSIWSKTKPNKVYYDIPRMYQLKEGRIIVAEYDNFVILNTYVPNTGREIAENHRQVWHNSLMEWLPKTISNKFFIWCGDLNVVREPSLDTTHHKVRKTGKNLAGLKQFEKDHLDEYLSLGLKDVFRELYPTEKSFTWYSNFSTENNIIGWRLDYFLVNDMSKVKNITTNKKLHKMISDHTWIMLELN